MFATTSGTTGAAKYIPVTPSYLHEYSHGIHVHTYRLFCDFPDVLEGRLLVSSSNDEEGRTAGGVPFGAISGYLTRTQPGLLRRYFAPPYEVCRIKDIESKYYLTLRHALAADIRATITPNPSSLLLLAQAMQTTRRRTHRGHPPRHRQSRLPARRRRPGPDRRSGAEPRRAAELAACVRAHRAPHPRRGLAQPPGHQLLEGRHDAALPPQAARVLRRRAGAGHGLHGQRRPGVDAAGQLGRGRGPQRHDPLLRVRARPSSATGPTPTS